MREKVAQMTQLDIYSMMNGDDRNPHTALNKQVAIQYAQLGIGSILNCPFPGPTGGRIGWSASDWLVIINQIKDIYRQHSKTPMIYGIDTIHGATYVKGATLFGQPLSAASSFNPELVYQMGQIEAKDTLSAGIPWVFSPVLGIAVQPRWSRVYETFGEDPHLASVMGASIIRGIQSSGRVAACMKHFIGYSNPTSGLDRADNVITDWDLVNHFARPFLAAVQAGVQTAMETYVSVNGYPVIASHKLLVDLLRKDMKFTGMMVSDYSEIDRMMEEHHLVPSVAEAVRVSLSQTSLDMNMGPNVNDFMDTVEALVQKQLLAESRLDASVLRILNLKKSLGLLREHAAPPSNGEDDPVVGSAKDQQVALQLARESIVLLENQANTLPLDRYAANSSIFITGPIADNKGYMCGGWSVYWQGSSNSSHFPNGKTFKDAMMERSGPNLRIEHLNVVDTDGQMAPEDLRKGLIMAEQSEYTIVLLGEANYAEKSGDIDDLSLPEGQRVYLQALTEITTTKVILVLITGRPRLLHGAHAGAKAVLLSMLPCEQGGEALAEIVFGDVNPSAKLPITYPKTSGAMLPYFHRVNTVCKQWDECPVEWEFGYGLSYTQFKYSDLALNTTKVHATDSLEVTVTLENAGSRDGSEAVLLFVAQKYRLASVPEHKLLKRFQKLHLKAHERQSVKFVLTMDDWSYFEPHIGSGFEQRTEPGEFVVSIMTSRHMDEAPQADEKAGEHGGLEGRGGVSHERFGGPNGRGSGSATASVSNASQLSASFFVVI